MVAIAPVATIDENQFASLSLTFDDPGTLDVHQVQVDWGDGSAVQTLAVAAGARTFTATHQYLDDNAADQYTISLRVLDDDGGVSDTKTTTVTVKNVAPSMVNIAPVAMIDENQFATLSLTFDDPGTLDAHQVEVDWGDGTAVQTLAVVAGTRSFSATHQYLDDNAADQYTISVRVLDDDGGASPVTTATVTVKNVAPSMVNIAPVALIDEDQFATLSLTFNDPGTLDTHQVEVDWGDGTPLQTLAVVAGARTLTAAHQYLDDNAADQYTISVRVLDDDGGASPVTTATVVVKNVAPSMVAIAPVAMINENQNATLNLTFVDPGSIDVHQVEIDWGDGSALQMVGVPLGARTFSTSHQYLDDNAADQYTITLRVLDDDGGASPLATTTVVVKNVPPLNVAVLPAAGAVAEGSPLAFNFTFDDPGSLDTHTFQIDWGDGFVTTGAAIGHAFQRHAHVCRQWRVQGQDDRDRRRRRRRPGHVVDYGHERAPLAGRKPGSRDRRRLAARDH